VRELEQKLAGLEAERAAARAKGRDRVVAPAASAKPQDQERIARQDQERGEQQEARRREEERQALETLLAEERKRADEAAAAAEEAARAAAAIAPPEAPSASAALPEPGVRPGQLVSLDDPSVIAPVAQRAPPPPYPTLALRQRVEGTVVLNVLVDEAGKVADTQVVSAAGGKTGLNEAAVDYVRQWMFRGATKDGVPVKVWYPVKVDFRLPR
jgi:protein TonB